jgi:hypothetical protein
LDEIGTPASFTVKTAFELQLRTKTGEKTDPERQSQVEDVEAT